MDPPAELINELIKGQAHHKEISTDLIDGVAGYHDISGLADQMLTGARPANQLINLARAIAASDDDGRLEMIAQRLEYFAAQARQVSYHLIVWGYINAVALGSLTTQEFTEMEVFCQLRVHLFSIGHKIHKNRC